MLTAQAALERLREGNLRFVAGTPTHDPERLAGRRAALIEAQSPFAVILGCSDSRVPAEIVFDQGLGDLFVIRVAGNIVAPSLIGSVEFAADRFGTRLVIVLGHTRCGAVTATLEELQRPAENQSRHIRAIVDRVRPAVEAVQAQSPDLTPEELLHRAVRANIAASVHQLSHGSEVLEELIRKEGLQVVGAEYALETGTVEFLA